MPAYAGSMTMSFPFPQHITGQISHLQAAKAVHALWSILTAVWAVMLAWACDGSHMMLHVTTSHVMLPAGPAMLRHAARCTLAEDCSHYTVECCWGCQLGCVQVRTQKHATTHAAWKVDTSSRSITLSRTLLRLNGTMSLFPGLV